MLWMALVTGVGVLFIACIACVAALNFHRTWAKLLLVCYGFLLFILLALECGAIALVWMRRSEFSDCQCVCFTCCCSLWGAVPGCCC